MYRFFLFTEGFFGDIALPNVRYELELDLQKLNKSYLEEIEKYKKEILHEGLQIEEEGLVGLHKKLSSPTTSKKDGNQGVLKEGQERAVNRRGSSKVKPVTEDKDEGVEKSSTVFSKGHEETTVASVVEKSRSDSPLLKNDTQSPSEANRSQQQQRRENKQRRDGHRKGRRRGRQRELDGTKHRRRQRGRRKHKNM